MQVIPAVFSSVKVMSFSSVESFLLHLDDKTSFFSLDESKMCFDQGGSHVK